VRTVVIIGAGELGGALARRLAAADVCAQIVLVDDAGRVAEGKSLDIRQAAPVDGYRTNTVGTTDDSVVVGADAVVIADRAATNGEWQDDAGVALVRRVAYRNPTAMILCAGAQQLTVIEQAVREGGVPHRRLFGSAPEGLRSAVISLTALEAGCSPTDVSLTVVGRPPAHSIVPWEDAAIGGRRLTGVLGAATLARLDARLTRLWPPGPLTLASAATKVLTAAAMRAGAAVSVFVAVQNAGGRVGMLPVTMQRHGIATILAPTLTARDRVRLDTALLR
jgi:malate dehydrogenase